MKITVRQLKQLIREQVEEMAGANRSSALKNVLDSIRALSPDDFEAFEEAVLSPSGAVNPELRPDNYHSEALQSKKWARISRGISDAELGRMGREVEETLMALVHNERVSASAERKLIAALKRAGHSV
jgi:hypothetical protein